MVVMLADIAIAVHDGRQYGDRPTVYSNLNRSYSYIGSIGLLAVSANHAFCNLYQLKALMLVVGDAIEKTVAAVKLAAASESDCRLQYGPHNASGRTRMDVG